jgi:hypothetical protein
MLLPVQECGKGVNKDLLPSELAPGVWSDSSNVRYRNGFAEKLKGTTAANTTPTAVPYWIGTFHTSAARFLVQIGTATAFVDDGSTRTEITGTPPTGSRDDRWSGFDFNGIFVCGNGADDPMFWNGDTGTNLATLTGWAAGTKADAMCAYREYIFSLAVTIGGTKYPYRVIWGNAAEPGALPTTYTAAATNDAGDKDIVGIGHLIDGKALGDALIVYGQEGRYAIRWIGGEAVFSFQRLPGKDGLLARGCVVDTPVGHVFVTNGDIRLHQGGESVSIAEGVVRKWFAATLDATNARRAFVCLNQQETEVWVCFPSTGQSDCDTVLAWNWQDKTWGVFTAPNLTHGTSGLVSSALGANIWSGQSQTWEQTTSAWSQNEASSNEARLIVATSTPTIGLANTGSLDFGTRVSWYLEKSGVALSPDGDAVRCISRVRPKLDATAGTQVTVKLATTMNQDDTPTFSNSSTYTQGTTNYVNQFTNGGRYGAVRYEGADDQPVAMRSYQLEVPGAGGRF